jgi:hypothetical protein
MRIFIRYLREKIWIAHVLVYGMLFFSVALLQHAYDKKYPHPWSELSQETYIFPEKVLPHVSFGFRNLFADYYWVKSIQDLTIKGQNFPLYLQYFFNMTTLDPRFEQSYVFGVYMLPSEHHHEIFNLIVPLADRGIANLPNSWQIPYYLGFQYQLIFRDYTNALKYISLSASRKDAPTQVLHAYRGMLTRTLKDDTVTSSLLKVVLQTSESESLKEFVKKDLVLDYLKRGIEKGIVAYQQKHGVFPKNISDLENEKLVTLPADFYTKIAVHYDAKKGSVTLAFKEGQ